jgi:AcrR family transcriptional regulator
MPAARRRSDSAPARRQYRSPQRQQQAQATRNRITTSARRLFADRGYAATSIEAIAEGAHVSVPTIYAAMRSKRAILLALLDRIEQEAGVTRLRSDVDAARGAPLRQLEVLVDLDCRLFKQNLDVLEILRDARAADPSLAPIWREGGRRRRRGQSALVKSWAAAKLLVPGLGEKQAADILWAFTGPDVYRLFVVESRWPMARFRQWLRGVLASLLFSPTPFDDG